MTLRPRLQRVAALSAALFLLFHEPAFAYIGPGAGFVFVSSFLALFVSFFLAFLYLISWPVRSLVKSLLKKKRVDSGTAPRRVIVLGLDGFDPKLVDRYMSGGKLPHFEQLKNSGTFVPLATSYPSISPVAWSSFATGTDASYHNIFDFLTRDPCTYAPTLSSVEIEKAAKSLPLGKYRIALSKPRIRGKRKSRTFWSVLGEYGVFNSVLRVPITYPPEKFDGVLLSGMCTPDLQGTQGTFSYFTSDASKISATTGGVRQPVTRDGDSWRGALTGPESPFAKNRQTLRLNFTARPD